ncbi:MAG: hypothetical protein AAF465_13465 [Pseudomonadota bacterium]
MKWIAHHGASLKAFHQTPALVDVYVCESDLHTYLVLGERWDNPAASITNNFQPYATQVMEWLDIDPGRVILLELYRRPVDHPRYLNQDEYTLDLFWPDNKPVFSQQKWRPLNDELRERILTTLCEQHQVTFSYEYKELDVDPWDIPGNQSGQFD